MPDIDIDEVEKEEVPFTIEDMDKLVPGMWLKCLYDTDDTKVLTLLILLVLNIIEMSWIKEMMHKRLYQSLGVCHMSIMSMRLIIILIT